MFVKHRLFNKLLVINEQFDRLVTTEVTKTELKQYILYVNIYFGYGFRRNGAARDAMRGDSDVHNFQEYTYKKITPCDVCSQVLRGKFILHTLKYINIIEY